MLFGNSGDQGTSDEAAGDEDLDRIPNLVVCRTTFGGLPLASFDAWFLIKRERTPLNGGGALPPARSLRSLLACEVAGEAVRDAGRRCEMGIVNS